MLAVGEGRGGQGKRRAREEEGKGGKRVKEDSDSNAFIRVYRQMVCGGGLMPQSQMMYIL